jgi:hypothetical protein
MTPSQSRWAALIQATVFTAAGLLVGIPLGLAAGRSLWRVTAGIIPLYYQAPVARGTLLLIGPAVLACGLLLALIPGHRAARLRAGPLLREEEEHWLVPAFSPREASTARPGPVR